MAASHLQDKKVIWNSLTSLIALYDEMTSSLFKRRAVNAIYLVARLLK